MTLYALDGLAPTLPENQDYWIAPSATVLGNVQLEQGVSIWFGSVLRGDNEPITLGAGSNVQENCTFHTDPGFPLRLGRNCTVGHGAIVHGAQVGDNSLIGMGAVVLNGAKIGKNCLIGAGAMITEGKEIPDGSLVLGSPGKVARALSESEIAGLTQSALIYQANYRRFKKGLTPLGE
ncbi:gamma carbonic anhydrase family protein [Amylibacter marinus]|uniref:Gamma carbonic anhydrase family protein n=1 Tax=Amylibacter marinus TaxID=1475483 RepID=A0ABQ5VX87_9RHOB|nr:gamma carbonic anhydrase family protein [Amylibacter marinus]GLQ36042.1 gamma carbonic anhydrase family protein [Amylibacter marinus]